MDYVVLVEPEGPGNVGSIARVMKNFGFNNLVLVNPKCKLDLETRKYAMHAWDIVENAITLSSFDDVFKLNSDVFVGTTAKTGKTTNTTRNSITPRELAKQVKSSKMDIALIFGRESSGLRNEELRKCDLVVNIPTNPAYKTMNISHASAIIMYEIFLAKEGRKAIRERMNRKEFERMIEIFSMISSNKELELKNPENATKIFRTAMSKSAMSSREARTIILVLSRFLRVLEEANRTRKH